MSEAGDTPPLSPAPPRGGGSTGSAPTESHGDDALDALVQRIHAKYEDVAMYLAAASRRGRNLVRVTIFGGSIAAALTASPALGGEPLADWLTEAFALSTPSWRILCALAAVCSLAATVATQVHRSNSYDEHIVRAQGVRASLEALEVGIASGHLTLQAATSQYMKCIDDASFIEAAGHP